MRVLVITAKQEQPLAAGGGVEAMAGTGTGEGRNESDCPIVAAMCGFLEKLWQGSDPLPVDRLPLA